MNCYGRGFDYARYRKHEGKPSLTQWAISMRSSLTHYEIQFSERYAGVSFSATMADGAKCCRFKMNTYRNAMWWWTTRPIKCGDIREDLMIQKACDLADVTVAELIKWLRTAWNQDILFGKNATKYDLPGCSISFLLPKRRIWIPDKEKMWCSEACKEVINAGFPWFKDNTKRPDETTPDDLDRELILLGPES